jgi:hypothetical protein
LSGHFPSWKSPASTSEEGSSSEPHAPKYRFTFTQAARDTWDKIIETVFFSAACNYNRHDPCHPDVFATQPDETAQSITGIALSIIGRPVGIGIVI